MKYGDYKIENEITMFNCFYDMIKNLATRRFNLDIDAFNHAFVIHLGINLIEDMMKMIDKMINDIQGRMKMLRGFENIDEEIERKSKMMVNFKLKNKIVEPKSSC